MELRVRISDSGAHIIFSLGLGRTRELIFKNEKASKGKCLTYIVVQIQSIIPKVLVKLNHYCTLASKQKLISDSKSSREKYQRESFVAASILGKRKLKTNLTFLNMSDLKHWKYLKDSMHFISLQHS